MRIDILNPKAAKLLKDLADLKLIAIQDTSKKNGYIIRYHKKIFRNSFLVRNMDFKKGDLYRQENYAKTVSNLSKTGVWQNVNIQTIERKDSSGKLDMILQMTHAIRYGVELNLNTQRSSRVINSNELSYTNTISYPRLLGAINLLPKAWFNNGKPISRQTFISINPAYTKRIDLFNLFSTGIAFGNQWNNKVNRKNVIKFPNIEYSYLFNQSDSFKTILKDNPYLRYSYNTALIKAVPMAIHPLILIPNIPTGSIRLMVILKSLACYGAGWVFLKKSYASL